MQFRLAPVALLIALLLGAVRGGHADERAQAVGDDLEQRKAEIIFRAKVKRAIQNGAHWIAQRQQRNGTFALDGNQRGTHPSNDHTFGRTVLCLYTLADCGYAPDHPVIVKALGYIKNNWRAMTKGDNWRRAASYSLSLLVLGFHTLYVKPGSRERTVERDRYGMRLRTKNNPCGYPNWVRRLIDGVLDWLMANQAEKGLFRYPGDLPGANDPSWADLMGGPEDVSNTQYVLLALWAGSRCGYDVPVEKLEKMAHRLLQIQQKEGPDVARVEDPESEKERRVEAGGTRYATPKPPPTPAPRRRDHARGFAYTPQHPTMTGSMTTAGMSSMAIVKAMLMERKALKKPLARLLDQGIWDAIAWLVENYNLEINPGEGSRWQYYYLYGLERACVIAGKTWLGDHDWYREGARLLIDGQKVGGRWSPAGQVSAFPGAAAFKSELLDTCFALLFLKRATVVPKTPVLDDGPVTTPSGGR